MTMTLTTIIISNLGRDDFVATEGKQLSLANQIKLAVLNLQDDFVHKITTWSDLAFLHRIIIIFKTPEAAHTAYKYLEASYDSSSHLHLPSTVKLSLQENLLQRSKLSEDLEASAELKVSSSLEKFRNFHNSGQTTEYREPEPEHFDPYTDLKKLGIDLSLVNDSEQMEQLANPPSTETQPSLPPKLGLGRSRSVTTTLFKPSLLIRTDEKASVGAPASPSITLEESF